MVQNNKNSPYASSINNNISVKAGDTKYHDGRFGVNNVDVLRGIIEDSMTPDAFKGISEFKGIVLKEVGEPRTNAGDDASRYLNDLEGSTSTLRDKSIKPLTKYYVRIPELHGYLPLPLSVSDKKRIEVHPIFTIETGQKEQELSSLQPTDIVTVKFNDIKNFRNGVITSRYAQGIVTSPENDKCPPPVYNFKTKDSLAVLQSVEIKSKSTHSGDPSPSLRSRTETKKVMLIGGRSMGGFMGEVLQKQYISLGYTLYDEDGNSTDYGVQPPRSFRVVKTGTTLKQMLINPVSEWTKKLIDNILKVRPDIIVLQFDEIFDSDNEGGAQQAAEIVKKTIYRLTSLAPLQQIFIIGTGKSSMSGPWPKYNNNNSLPPNEEDPNTPNGSPNGPWIEEIKKTFDIGNEPLLVSLKENVSFVDPFSVDIPIEDRRRQIFLWNRFFRNKSPSNIRIPKEQELSDGKNPEQQGTIANSNAHLVPLAVHNATKQEALKHIKNLIKKISGQEPSPATVEEYASRDFDTPEGGFTFYEIASLLGWDISNLIEANDNTVRESLPILWDQYITLVPKYDAITSVYVKIYKGSLDKTTTAQQNLAQKENNCLDLLKDAYSPTEDPYERLLTNRIMVDMGTRPDYPNPGWTLPIEETERLQLHKYKGIADLFPKNDGVSHRVILQPTRLYKFEEYERNRKWQDFTTDSYEWGLLLDSVDVINFKLSGAGGNDFEGPKDKSFRDSKQKVREKMMNSAVRAGIPIFGWGYAAPFCNKVKDKKNPSKKSLFNANAKVRVVAQNTASLIKKYGVQAYVIDAEQCWVFGQDPIGSMIYFVKLLREMCPDLRIISQAYSSFAKFSSIYKSNHADHHLLKHYKKINDPNSKTRKTAIDYVQDYYKKFLKTLENSGVENVPNSGDTTYEDFLQYMGQFNGKYGPIRGWHRECERLQITNKAEIRAQQKLVLDYDFLKIFDAYAPMRYSLTPAGMALDGMVLGLACQEAGGIPYIPTYTTGYYSQDNSQKNKLKATSYVNDHGSPDVWPTKADAKELWNMMKNQKGNPTSFRKKFTKSFYGPGLLTMAANNDIYGPTAATQYYHGDGYRGMLTVGTEVNPPFCFAAQAIRAGKQGYMIPNEDAKGAVKKQIKFGSKGIKTKGLKGNEKKLYNSIQEGTIFGGEVGELIEYDPLNQQEDGPPVA